ncbi:hypothetical protein NFI80_05655 [Dyadobacter chenhuakuii]|uniref:Uncharacterized protein n=1 Tax=Dyadobacter chenhuakuii TaxID=2909339 RepID=A0ABY4XQ53_9BACT|nr:hypothetical protein [Dyadobacter chenhuakuii]MCF2494451.1 hypothetical protein [Dyadobacter chenhuakuii]USJ32223.1 hypothetical protein NFI80_05655 [Dyadobacter chenhuakuii]
MRRFGGANATAGAGNNLPEPGSERSKNKKPYESTTRREARRFLFSSGSGSGTGLSVISNLFPKHRTVTSSLHSNPASSNHLPRSLISGIITY